MNEAAIGEFEANFHLNNFVIIVSSRSMFTFASGEGTGSSTSGGGVSGVAGGGEALTND